MNDVLRHRGPDDRGVHIDGNVGLAHRRLAIIDLTAGGRQPMSTEDGRHTVVFNGEIYNYRELKDKYCEGVKMRSSSDTEVLLHVLAKLGRAGLKELRGMFALAWWDNKEKKLMLATDPFGKKPLYYVDDKDRFVFASEIKALLQHPKVAAKCDKKALIQYLLYEYVPGELTGYEQIRRLPMGSYAIVADGKRVKVDQWWRAEWKPKLASDFDQRAEEMDSLLRQAVKRRLVADVPVGVLLSGGLDSTSIAWYMKQSGAQDLHSFSVSFAENTFDEAAYAQQAAHTVGCEHHNMRFGISEFNRLLDGLMDKMDIPFSDSSFLPTWAVSELAKEKVKVVLDGDGSDELLGGYGVWQAAELAGKLPRLNRNWWSLVEKGVNLLPTKFDYFSFDFKAKSFLKGMGLTLPVRHQVWMGSFAESEMLELVSQDMRGFVSEVFKEIDGAGGEEGLAEFDQISAQTIHNYLQNDILVKLDRASMIESLEARTPFLDVDLAEDIMRLPIEMKREKKILKHIMRGRIPDSIIDRQKQGFALPLGYWLRGPLYEWANNVLTRERVDSVGLIRYEVVKKLLDDHRRGRVDNRKKLWTSLMLVMWHDRWISGKHSS